MSKVEQLIHKYEQFVSLPWDHTLAGPRRVWFLVYDKAEERRARARIGEFELATKKAHHGWALCDLTDAFAHWMAAEEYRESYFESPEDLDLLLRNFRGYVANQVRTFLMDSPVDKNTVVALQGVASLFGFIRTSELLQDVVSDIRGRLLVFFPGEYENNNYRLLDARDGWNYTAVPITLQEGAETR